MNKTIGDFCYTLAFKNLNISNNPEGVKYLIAFLIFKTNGNLTPKVLFRLLISILVGFEDVIIKS
jgi:hypothetical protein